SHHPPGGVHLTGPRVPRECPIGERRRLDYRDTGRVEGRATRIIDSTQARVDRYIQRSEPHRKDARVVDAASLGVGERLRAPREEVVRTVAEVERLLRVAVGGESAAGEYAEVVDGERARSAKFGGGRRLAYPLSVGVNERADVGGRGELTGVIAPPDLRERRARHVHLRADVIGARGADKY